MTYLFAVRENSCWQKHPQLRRNHSYQDLGWDFLYEISGNIFKRQFYNDVSNRFAFYRFSEAFLCPLIPQCSHIRSCELIGVPFKQGLLFRNLTHLKRNEIMLTPFNSSAAQALLSVYTQELPNIYFSESSGYNSIHGLNKVAVLP